MIDRFFGSALTERVALYVVIVVSVALLLQVTYASTKSANPSATLEPCAVYITIDNGLVCR